MISVIVPVYNVESYLTKCLQSIMEQNTDIEVILIDDGSNDGTVQICDMYSAKDRRIHVVHVKNAGVSNARNMGLSLAKGKYITFVDGDDWLASDFLEIGIKKMEETDVDIFMGGYVKNFADGSEITIGDDIGDMKLNAIECIEKIFVKSSNKLDLAWSVWGKIFKAELWKNVSFRSDISMGEDAIAFWDVLKNACTLLYMPIIGYHYFQRDNSAMHILSVKNVLDNLKMYKYFFYDCERFDNLALSNYFEQRYYMSEIESVIRLAVIKNSDKDMINIQKNVHIKAGKYFKVAWNFNKVYGVVKVLIACMPKRFIKAFVCIYDSIRALSFSY